MSRLMKLMQGAGVTVGSTGASGRVIASSEAIVADIDNGFNGIQAIQQTADDLEVTAQHLAGLQMTAESFDGVGGMKRGEATIMHQAASILLGPLEIPTANVIPSAESFGGSNERAHATTLSAEGLGEAVKGVWEAILEAIESARVAISKWWKGLWDKIPGIIERAEKLKEKAEGENGTAKDKDFEMSGVGSLSIGDKVEGIAKNFGAYSDTARDFMDDHVGVVRGQAKKLVDAVKGMPTDNIGNMAKWSMATGQDVLSKMATGPVGKITGSGAEYITKKKLKTTTELKVSDTFIGDKVVVAWSKDVGDVVKAMMAAEKVFDEYVDDKGAMKDGKEVGDFKTAISGDGMPLTELLTLSAEAADDKDDEKETTPEEKGAEAEKHVADAIGGVIGNIGKKVTASLSASIKANKVTFENHWDEKDISKEHTVDVLSTSDVSTICDDVIELAKAIQKFQKDEEENSKVKKSLTDAVSKASKQVDKMDDAKEASPIMTNVTKIAKDFAEYMDSPVNAMTAHSMKTMLVSLNVCDKSLGMYK